MISQSETRLKSRHIIPSSFKRRQHALERISDPLSNTAIIVQRQEEVATSQKPPEFRIKSN